MRPVAIVDGMGTRLPSAPQRVLLALTALLAISCASAPKPDGRSALATQIQFASKGMIAVTSYRKTNGADETAGGTKLYTVWYQAQATFKDDCYWLGLDHPNVLYGGANPFNCRGYDELSKPEQRELTYTNSWSKLKFAKKGDHIQLAGTIQFQLTERGWITVRIIQGGRRIATVSSRGAHS